MIYFSYKCVYLDWHKQNGTLIQKKCSEIFNKYKIYDYIETCYEFFHIQGDEENFNDINNYLKNNGVEL